ncbi:TPA: helix-turn-helix domain-containing protein [Serratia marcescens]
MKFDSHCAERLKSERKRLSYNQSQVAELCGISREMWGKYERGLAVPGGEVFLGFALAGGNVQYVLTGESSGVVLTRDELELVQHFRDAPLAVKAAAFAALTAGSAATDSKAINVSGGKGLRIAGRDFHEHKSK